MEHSLVWMTGPPGVAVACLGLPSLQHPLGELQATAGVAPAAGAGDVVVVAGVVAAAGEVLPPTMGVGVADDDVVEEAGAGLVLFELAPPNEPTMPDTIDMACMCIQGLMRTAGTEASGKEANRCNLDRTRKQRAFDTPEPSTVGHSQMPLDQIFLSKTNTYT